MQKGILTLMIFLSLIANARAQDLNAPYSAYGIGDLDFRYYDKSAGMGHTSMGILSTPYNIVFKNPASLAGLDRSNVVVNGAFVGKLSTYTGDAITSSNNKARDFTVKQFSLAIKLNKFWASGISVMPYSYVGYSYRSNLNIEGSANTYDALYTGDGGLYNVAWTNAFNVGKHLSFGIRSSFLFGSINQTETLQSDLLSVPINTKKTDYYHNFRFEYGGLYHTKLTKDLQFSVGGKFTAKTRLNSEQSLLMTQGNSTIKQEDVVKTGRFYLPMSYDLGVALTSKGKTTYAVDYTYENWDGINTNGYSWSMINSHRLSAGVQFSNQMEAYNMKFEKNYWQMGLFADRSYLRIRNTPIDEVGATIGYGGYMTGRLSYGLSLEAGRRGATTNQLIRENYVQFTLRLSYREFLFSKGRKYD